MDMTKGNGRFLLSKRQFFQVSASGTAAIFLAPWLKLSARAGSFIYPLNYLESSVHEAWMKLTYSAGNESRAIRRLIGTALRNIGTARGQGRGAQFAAVFDEAVQGLARSRRDLVRRPANLFEIIQCLYDEYILPVKGAEYGRILFGNLFFLLRGRDGTAQAEEAHGLYSNYRRAALDVKQVGGKGSSQEAILQAKALKAQHLQSWQETLASMKDAYASRKLSLNPQFQIQPAMVQGFTVRIAALQIAASQVNIQRDGNQVVVSWEGDATLLKAPTVNGPWNIVQSGSPAVFDASEPEAFFRTTANSSPQ